MWLLIVAVISTSSRTVTGSGRTGGCAGTEYGCCPDGVTPSNGLGYHGCPQRHVATSPACEKFLDSLPITCGTRTSCLDIECDDTIQGIQVLLEFDVHKCRDRPSVNTTMVVPSQNFRWSHEFVGNTTLIIPDLQLTISALPGLVVRVIVDIHVFRKNRDIYMSCALEPTLGSTPGKGFSLYRYMVLDEHRLPINTSDCYGPPTCSINCSNCLNGDDGWVCYTCPSSCPSQLNHPVCGNDMMSYSSECKMRARACEMKKALRVLYPGHCVSEPPTQFSVLTMWPRSLINESSNTQKFIRGAVVFLVVSVSEHCVQMYTQAYFTDKISLVLGYKVVVPAVTKAVRSKRDVENLQLVSLNVTLYAHYHSSVGNEVFVPNTELVNAIQQSKAKLEEVVNVQIVSASRSYTSQPLSTTRSSGSSTNIIIAVVVSVLGGFLLVAVALIVYFYYQRRKWSGKEAGKEDLVYLPGQDELARESSTDDNPDFSKTIQ